MKVKHRILSRVVTYIRYIHVMRTIIMVIMLKYQLFKRCFIKFECRSIFGRDLTLFVLFTVVNKLPSY